MTEPPKALLQSVPYSSAVALHENGNHSGHFNFYSARPDVQWEPLNISRTSEKAPPKEAINTFIHRDLNYCLIIGKYPAEIPVNLALHSADNIGHLISKKTTVESSE